MKTKRTKKRARPAEPECRVCGCTQQRACLTADGRCYWVEPDLCSACAKGFNAGVAACVAWLLENYITWPVGLTTPKMTTAQRDLFAAAVQGISASHLERLAKIPF